MVVSMDLAALRDLKGRASLAYAPPVDPEVARRIACDAVISRMVLSARSEPLDIGRKSPVIPAPMRRALQLRDHRCRFLRCGRPPRWSDGHHITHWADGGPTCLDNLVLLCRAHHRMIHRSGFGVVMQAGRPVFFRPDGAVIPEDRGPP